MLIRAFKRENELKELMEKAFDDKDYSRYYFNSSYFEPIQIESSEWREFNYLSVDSNDKIIGYVGCTYIRLSREASWFKLINFSKKTNMIFVKDVLTFIDNLFREQKIDHMTWYVANGNPAEKMYDKFIKKYKGYKSSAIPRYYYNENEGYRDAYIYTITKENYFAINF